MIKWMGVLFLVLGTTAFGVYQAGRYIQRLNNMQEIRKAFLYIQGEIRYLNTPLPEALEGAACRVQGPCKELFLFVADNLNGQAGDEFYNVWKAGMHQVITSEMLEWEAREELKGIGSQLGCLDGKTQERVMEFFLEKWEGIIQQRCQEKKHRLKLYYVCGIMSGLLVVMILI